MEKVIDIVKEFDKEIEVVFENDITFYLSHKNWRSQAFFEIDSDIEDVIEELKYFLNYKYISNLGIINENYVELSINLCNRFFLEHFKGAYLSNDNESIDNIYYEIGMSTDDFNKIAKLYNEFTYPEPEDYITTIKIYNIDSVMNKSYKCEEFADLVLEIAKSIFFELSGKYSIFLYLIPIVVNYDDEDSSIIKIKEKLENLSNQRLKGIYDKDLLDYYYRAMQMPDSEFKYIAFYQVMECIYDEVYLEENVNDIKQVINSSWFSFSSNEDITKIIKIVEQYNKNRNDREKSKLVLEKYFRGNIHDEAYFLANKEIIDILMEMGLIKKQDEIKDIQKIGNIVYDYRCACTHSNRTFPSRTSYNDLSEKMQKNYINLIKKISERIIMNYGASEI
ncbi:MAG: hypothetical protein E6X81_14180 [Clostridium butyricum]|nr:hypothetical protein [Clostridium butyricum]